jgi:hypothetical protein
MPSSIAKLQAIKVIHTVVWGFFASAIFLIPIAAWLKAWGATLLLIGVVGIECLVVVLSGMRCPLTPLAARYTEDRADNFDIYLPLWLARYNKEIFGTLFLAGLVFSLMRFLG